MKNVLLTAAVSLAALTLSGQTSAYQQPFNQDTAWRTCPGVNGTALNLSSSVAVRKPVMLPAVLKQYEGAYTVQCWAKAAADNENYVLLSTTPPDDPKQPGWKIGVQANGAWYWEIRNGNTGYTYYPTPQRQSIRDGRWHQLTYSFDAAKQEAALYLDGRQMAIYHIPGIPAANSPGPLYAGGLPSGDIGEWNTFNGELDELVIYKTVLSPQQVRSSYARYFTPQPEMTLQPGKQLTVMNYNIWHGGNETGKGTGPQRITDIIRQSGADIVSMQETYGSGEKIADALGYYFYLRSSNLSIMSRFPIAETLDGERPFYNGGAYIRLNQQQKIAFITNWLSYPFDYWDMLEKNQPLNIDTLLAGMEKHNAAQLSATLKVIRPYINNAETVPVIFCGDLNSGSHLDWVESTRSLNHGYVVPFPQSRLMLEAGFTDSYRKVHPDPLKDRGITWSPQFPQAFKDRIDYIYYKGKLRPVKSFTITTHPVRYPSDHAALVTVFSVE